MRVSGIPFVQGQNDYPDADGRKYGIAIHATANTASAKAEAAYAKRRTDNVSAHFYADDEDVIQSLDTTVRAGHAGSRLGNDNGIAVEITGLNSWTRAQWLARVNWALLGRVLREVCAAYGIAVRRASVQEMRDNPKIRAFYGHDDMRRAWGGTDHTDPGGNFPWDHLLSVVASGDSAMTGDDDMTWNQGASADAVFNNQPSAELDTSGAGDGTGPKTAFPNHTYTAIQELRAKIAELEAAAGLPGEGGGLTAGQARAIAREEIAAAKLTPGDG